MTKWERNEDVLMIMTLELVCVCVVNWDWASQLQAVVVLHLISMDSFLLLWEEMQTWVKGIAKCLISGQLIHYHQGLTSVTLSC